ncbi:extracellular solute-binding protein [Lederbergia sp. NSJ-179]|uniref:extracellular solute-binding protein n=1 Tax=Lederbergia sp. NSJ-179 TaxID=2931402 RepID=UPI001FD096D2|nr:extracellular solute-binding protein [Lederbergia sp. NSJ-179]MCJ7840734.1 extracellular solute-binding protein [Lederbergia sp. NSJ-179]
MNKKWWLSFLVISLSLLMLIGCTKKTSKEAKKNEEVTLKMLIAVDEEVFNNRFKEQIDDAFPKINLELMEGNPADADQLQELFAKGEVPDIITVAFHENQQNIAMWVASATHLPLIAPVDGINFDMVTTPVWKDLPNTGPSAVALSFNITKQSKHPDEAFKVIVHLASPEGQKVLSRAGSPPTIEDM